MRAKFLVHSIEPVGTPDSGVVAATLTAVYGGETNAEDNQFSAATPYGNLTMHISNPAARDFLKVGGKYYLDFTEAEAPPVAEEAPAEEAGE